MFSFSCNCVVTVVKYTDMLYILNVKASIHVYECNFLASFLVSMNILLLPVVLLPQLLQQQLLVGLYYNYNYNNNDGDDNN